MLHVSSWLFSGDNTWFVKFVLCNKPLLSSLPVTDVLLPALYTESYTGFPKFPLGYIKIPIGLITNNNNIK